MKCICKQKCFIPYEGRNRLFKQGEVFDFEKCPTHFAPLSSSVDFLTAGEDELMNSKWNPDKAKVAIKDAYGVTITATATEKEKIVEQILDARNRHVDTSLPDKAK